jgi:C4-type Zn-finger protein
MSTTTGLREHTESAASCPACGQPGSLIALGARYDHPYRWRPWVMKPTQLALCARCDALVEMEERRRPKRTAGAVTRAAWSVVPLPAERSVLMAHF